MSEYVDLHLHTTLSDGKKTPDELLEIVRRVQLAAFAVTDHDTLDGYRGICRLLRPDDPELISGVELSALAGDRDLHILAYFVDPDDSGLREALAAFKKRRDDRGEEMVAKLNQLGVRVTFEAVKKAAGDGVVGRPHIAEAMVACGAVNSYEAAFQKYISNSGPAYIPKARMMPDEAIDLTHRSGGVAVLAHPFLDDMYKHLPQLVEMGLDGLEVYHYTHTARQVEQGLGFVRQYGLAPSGGSDFHGRQSRSTGVGSQRVPITVLEGLQERRTATIRKPS